METRDTELNQTKETVSTEAIQAVEVMKAQEEGTSSDKKVYVEVSDEWKNTMKKLQQQIEAELGKAISILSKPESYLRR